MVTNSKIIYIDQNKWSDIAKYLCNYKDLKNKEKLKQIYEKIFDKMENNSWIFPMSTIHMIEICKYSNIMVNEKIIRLLANQKIQLGDFFSVLKDEILRNLEGKPSLDSYLLKYDFLSLPNSELNIDKNGSNLSDNYIKELIKFYNDFAFDMILNKDFVKFDKLRLATDESSNLHNNIKESSKLLNLFVGNLFSTGYQYLEIIKPDYLNIKMLYGKEHADRMYIVKTFRELYSEIFDDVNKKPIPDTLLCDDNELYNFAFKNNSFHMYIKLILDLLSNATGKIDKNDFKDIYFLSVAVPYCDIVIAEKKWVNVVKNKRLDVVFDTKVSSDLNLLLSEC